MADRNRITSIPLGTRFEYRVARLRFAQGFFVRRAINVWPARLEGSQLAELDCVTLVFDPHLRRRLEVIECKTGASGQGEIDRLLWLVGIQRLAQSQIVTFAKTIVAPRVRDLAKQLAIEVLEEETIIASEQSLGLAPDDWFGFHNPDFGERIVKQALKQLNSASAVQGVGKYLFGSFWLTDDFTRIKQLRRAVQLLVRNESALSSQALLLGLGEAVVLFMTTIVSIAAWQNQLDKEAFREMLSQELSTGLGDARGLRTLLRRVDEFHRGRIEALHETYESTGAARQVFTVTSLEAEILTPPEWVDALVDLAGRVLHTSRFATDAIRWADLWAARLLGAEIDQRIVRSMFEGREKQLQDALELVLTFFTRVWGVPADYLALANPAITDSNVSRYSLGLIEDSPAKTTDKEPNATIISIENTSLKKNSQDTESNPDLDKPV